MDQKLFDLMEWLESGLYWKWHVNENVDEMLRFLMENGFCEAREDIGHDLLKLTQKGKMGLELARKQAAEKAEKQSEKEAAETKRLEERKEDRAAEERRYKGQNWTTILAAILGSAVTLLIEHLLIPLLLK